MGQTAISSADPGVRAGELFEAHGRMVYALCRLILRDGVEAEDAAQQTFLSAYRSLLNGTGPDQPEAWLATIARNECRQRISRRPPSTVELLESDSDGAPDLPGVLDSRAEMEALCAAVAELPTKQREAIVLREFYGLSYREVAAALGTTGTAVESAIFKSRRSLQARLRPMRDAAGSLALPLSLQDSLAQAIPGFSQAVTGGGGAALVAKLSVPFGVKALVAGMSVVAVGGTLATEHPRKHGAPAVAPAALHALATRPTDATTPRVHTAPVIIHSVSVKHTVVVAAHATPATRPRTHVIDDTAHNDTSANVGQSDDAQPVEHESGGGGSPQLATVHDDSAKDAERQRADDTRDEAEHAEDGARDATDAARAAQTD